MSPVDLFNIATGTYNPVDEIIEVVQRHSPGNPRYEVGPGVNLERARHSILPLPETNSVTNPNTTSNPACGLTAPGLINGVCK